MGQEQKLLGQQELWMQGSETGLELKLLWWEQEQGLVLGSEPRKQVALVWKLSWNWS